MKQLFSPLKNEKGILTLDLIFGFSLVLGAMVVMFAVCLTFAAIEISQYIAFSTSRAYYAAHLDENAQMNAADNKFDDLAGKGAVRNMLRPSWFELRYLGSRFYGDQYEDVMSTSSSPLWGTEVQLNANLLNFNIPFFGATSTTGRGLSTRLNSLIGREPSQTECMEYHSKRWNAIRSKATGSGGFTILSNTPAMVVDDGC